MSIYSSNTDKFNHFKEISKDLIKTTSYTNHFNKLVPRKIKGKKITDFGDIMIANARFCGLEINLELLYYICTLVLNDKPSHICKMCDNFCKHQDHIYCSHECRGNDIDWINSVSESHLKRTGYKWGSTDPNTKAKIRSSFEKTCMERYGELHASNAPGRIDRYKETCMERYGVENASQDSEIFAKQQSHKNSSKKYTLPSGNVISIQGYEPMVYDLLFANGYNESDFIFTNRPSIKYFWSSMDGFGDDKWHVYHPDIVIRTKNKIIEVKSVWTYDNRGKNPEMLSKNLAKKNGAINQGWDFEFMIFE